MINTESVFDHYVAKVSRTEQLQCAANRYLRNIIHTLEGFSHVVNDSIGNVLLGRVNENCFPGNCHELFLYLLKQVQIGVLPANAFGFPIESGNAWFRLTTIHDHPERIAEQLDKVNNAIVHWRRLN
jgi:aspartate/methionine/tyrosine aminotransferase